MLGYVVEFFLFATYIVAIIAFAKLRRFHYD